MLYLMRHMHADDLSFLESFHDDELAHPSPVNAIGLLSRADEVAVGRPDAMRVAERIAARYRTDERLRKLCQTVLPVGGLLAETAATLTQDEFEALERLAGHDREQIEALMLSADRFVADTAPVLAPPRRPPTRESPTSRPVRSRRWFAVTCSIVSVCSGCGLRCR